MWKRARFFCCLLLGALPGAFCAAQEAAPIEISKIDYSLEIVNPSFAVGSAIDVHVNPKDIASAGGAQNLQARIIRGSKSDLTYKVRFRTRNGCLFYNSHVYPIGASARGFRVLRASGGLPLTLDMGWLSRERRTVGQGEYFVLVIEKKSQSSSDVLRIFPKDAASYFSSGLEFIVPFYGRLNRDEEDKLIKQGEKSQEATAQAARASESAELPVPQPGEPAVGPRSCRALVRLTTGVAFLELAPCQLAASELVAPGGARERNPEIAGQ